MIEKLKLDNLGSSEPEFDFWKMFHETKFDPLRPTPKPPIAMGIGYHNYKNADFLNPTFTYGEMSTIIAPEKSKKTMFKTALIACYIGGNSNNYFPSIASNKVGDKYVIDIDTEQGDYYAEMSFRRVYEMVGKEYSNYMAFGLKKYTDDERVIFIDALVKEFSGKIGWMSIDGIADLCENTNDIEKSKKVAKKMMDWNSTGLHLCAVLHKTFEKERGTGHLGSFVAKKSESVIFLKSTDINDKNSPVEVSQKASRGAPFDNFHFDLDIENLIPKECEPQKW